MILPREVDFIRKSFCFFGKKGRLEFLVVKVTVSDISRKEVAIAFVSTAQIPRGFQDSIERLRITFTVNCKCEISVYVFSLEKRKKSTQMTIVQNNSGL